MSSEENKPSIDTIRHAVKRLRCSQHKGRHVKVICLHPSCSKKFLCLNCIITDPDHINLHKESLIHIDKYLVRQPSSHAAVCQQQLGRAQNYRESLQQQQKFMANSVEEIERLVDAEYQSYKEAIISLIEVSSEKFKGKARCELENKMQDYENALSKLSSIKSIEQVEKERQDIIESLHKELEKGCVADETLFISIHKCLNTYSNEEKQARALYSEIEQFRKQFNSQKTELLKSIQSDYNQLQKEDLKKLDGLVADHFSLKKKGASKGVVNQSIDKILSSQMDIEPIFQPQHNELKEEVVANEENQEKPTKKSHDKPSKSLGKFALMMSAELGGVMDYPKASILVSIPVISKVLHKEYHKRTLEEAAKLAKIEQKKKDEQKENIAMPSNRSRPGSQKILEPVLQPQLKAPSVPAFAVPPVRRAPSKENQKPLVEPVKIKERPSIIEGKSLAATLIEATQERPLHPVRTERFTTVDSVLQRLERFHETHVNNGSSQQQRSTTQNHKMTLKDLVRAPEPSPEELAMLYPANNLANRIEENSEDLQRWLKKPQPLNLQGEMKSNSNGRNSDQPAWSIFDRITEIQSNETGSYLAKRDILDTSLDTDYKIPHKKNSDIVGKKFKGYGKDRFARPQADGENRKQLKTSSQFNKENMGSENRYFGNKNNVLKPVNLNIQKQQIDNTSKKPENVRKILKYFLNRSYQGLTFDAHTDRGLAEGKSFYFTGCQPSDYIEARLEKETYVKNVVVEPPRLEGVFHKDAQRLKGAELQVLNDGEWLKICDVDFNNKCSMDIPVNTNASAFRVVHGHEMNCTTPLGLGRLVLLG